MRALSRVVVHKSGRVYIGVERSWRDLTRFEGETVPREVLETADAEMGFLEGGRGLELDPEVWTALRAWRGGVATRVYGEPEGCERRSKMSGHNKVRSATFSPA